MATLPRIAYATMRFPSLSETFAAVDLRALRSLGAEVSVLALRGRPAGCARILAERGLAGMPVSHASFVGGLRGLGSLIGHPLAAAHLLSRIAAWSWRNPRHLAISLFLAPRAMEIFARLRRDPPDVLHLFWGHYPCLLACLVQRFLPRVRTSIFLGAYDAEEAFGGSRPTAAGAHAVFTHARANLADLARLGIDPARVHVVHRGIDPVRLDQPAAVKVPGRVVVAGRLIASKGIADALAAFALAAVPGATLHVLGDGPERAQLERLAEERGLAGRVRFLGHVAHDRVYDEMNAAEVFLLLSTKASERLPNAAKEAVACGCAVVVSRSPGIDELIEPGIGGWIVESRDAAGAARALAEACGDPVGRARRVDAARKVLRERFDAGKAMARYLAVWTS